MIPPNLYICLKFFESKINKDNKVMICAGLGGVGHYAIQLAKHYGARVVTTCSTIKKDFVMLLGVAEPIDYTSQKF